MSRAFPTERVQRADVGPPTEVTVIRCAACPAKLELTSKSKEPLPIDFVVRQADIKGWHVGKVSAAKDRCPDCRALYRRKSTITRRPTVAAQQEPPTMEMPKLNVVATPPAREMSKDDRRIIFAKIDEVYTGDHYAGGWTDKRIAEDLNVPRAWVEEIRSTFFGEARDNEEVRQFLADLAALKPTLETFAAERQKAIRRMDDLTTTITRLLKVGEEIRKTMTP